MTDDYDMHVREIYAKVLERNSHLFDKKQQEKQSFSTFVSKKIDEMFRKLIVLSASPMVGSQQKIKFQSNFGQLLDMIAMYLDPRVVQQLTIEEYGKSHPRKF